MLAAEWGEVAVRPATVDDPDSLDRALAGAAAVINCAGPFAVTAGPVVEAALRAGIPYVDVAAEIEANASMFADYAEAPEGDIPVVPAMAFYGGLGDLLVTAAHGGLDRGGRGARRVRVEQLASHGGHPGGGSGVPRASRGSSGAVPGRRAPVPRRQADRSRTGSSRSRWAGER